MNTGEAEPTKPNSLPSAKQPTDLGAQLRAVGKMLETLDRRGFSSPVHVGQCRYEPRAMTIIQDKDHALQVFVGDKSGHLYRLTQTADDVTSWGVEDLGAPFHASSIDCLGSLVFSGRRHVVGSSREGGVWVVDAACPAKELEHRLTVLCDRKGPHGRMLFVDPVGLEVWSSGHDNNVLRFCFDTERDVWRTQEPIRLVLPISAHCLDAGRSPEQDHLYLASTSGEIFQLARGKDGGFELHGKLTPACSRRNDWRFLVPLSAYGDGATRGVLAVALRHVDLLVARETRLERRQSHEFRAGITAASGFRLSGKPHTVIATTDAMLHVLRDHDDSGEDEVVCLDGPTSSFQLPAVAFAIQVATNTGTSPVALLGLANHQVQAWPIKVIGMLNRLKVNMPALSTTAAIEETLVLLRRNPFEQAIKRAVLKVLEGSSARPQTSAWVLQARRTIFCLLYGADRRVVFETLDLVEAIARSNPQSAPWATMAAFVRKFCLLGSTYTAPKNHRLQLAEYNANNIDDKVAYLGICAHQGFDTTFRHEFGAGARFGEVRCFVPLRPKLAGWYVATTYRHGVWLISAEKRIPLPVDPDWGTARNVFRGSSLLYFAFSDAGFKAIPWTRLESLVGTSGTSEEVFQPVHDSPTAVVSLCPLQELGSEGFAYGTADGRLGFFDGTGFHDLGAGDPKFAAPIWDLRSFSGEGRTYLLAAVGDGTLHMLEWLQAPESLRERGLFHVGESGRLRLTVPDEARFFAVGTESGKVYGLTVDLSDPQHPIKARWAYRAGDAVRDMHRFPALDEPSTRVLVVASLDCHLHVLDPDGRVRGTYFLPGFPVARFVSEQPQNEAVERHCEVVACAFEDRIWGLDLLNRREIRNRIDELLRASPSGPGQDDDEETKLLRWRAMSLAQVGTFVRKHALSSSAYDNPTNVLDDLESLLQSARYVETTETVIALVRRLFTPKSFHRILEDEPLHRRVAGLFDDIRAKWDLPASGPHRKVLLYWIRSLLRSIDTLETWRRWVESSNRLAERDGQSLAAAQSQLRFFLGHGSSFLQFKTLQYLERLLLGWPPDSKGILQSPTDPTRFPIDDVDWIINTIIWRIRLRPSEIRLRAPNWVALQIGRIFLGMMDRGVLCPAYLTRRLSAANLPIEISADFLDVLSHQAIAQHSARHEDVRGLVDYLSNAATVMRSVAVPGSANGLLSGLESMSTHCKETCALRKACPFDGFRQGQQAAFKRMCDLLAVTDLDGMAGRPDVSDPLISKREPACAPILSAFDDVIRAAEAYRVAKYDDTQGRLFEALQYDIFGNLVKAMDRVREQVQVARGIPQLEMHLVKRLASQWSGIILHERDHALVTDFLVAVNAHVVDPAYGDKNKQSTNWVDEPDALLATALRNLFMRFSLLGEPEQGWFLFYDRREEKVQVTRLVDNVISEVAQDEAITAGLKKAWMERNTFLALGEEEVSTQLRSAGATKWKVLMLNDPMTGGPGTIGFYAFGWSAGSDDSAAKRVGDTAEGFLWALALLHSLTEQRMQMSRFFAVVAHSLKEPVFTVRSLATDLCAERNRNRRDKEREQFQAIRNEARRLMGVIDGMLALRGRDIRTNKRRTPLRSVVEDVCRAATKNARSSGIELLSPLGRKEIYVMADPDQVYDTVRNLVENAIKYSPSGTEVNVRIDSVRGNIVVVVEDRGFGIPKEEHDRVFEAHFRGRMADKHHVPGLGLGLYTCRLYATLIGAHIDVESEEGEGSTFTVTFPKRIVCDE